jgi:outer membrane protein assembly factor BamA
MNYLKFGTIYDTRDNEANPMKGIWSEVIIVTAPKLLDNYENSFTKLSLIHRQYFTLIPSKLSFAYRVGYQGTVQGNPPFYYQPYLISSFSPSVLTEGLGGAKSLRGIRRDRIVGEDIVYGNFEFRWKFWQGIIKNQNFYLALSTFLDAGKVTKPIEIDKSLIPASENSEDYFDESSDKIHASSGIGMHVALNENFIVAFDYGLAFDKRDGDNGLYIGMNFLF